jgi:hypothetical protein
MKNLTEVAELFIKSIEYEIKKDMNKGDIEGANLKELTKLQVEQVLADSKQPTVRGLPFGGAINWEERN